MTSRKYFLGITAMMLVLFFMFMFSEIVKSTDSGYDANGHAKVPPIVHPNNEKAADAVKVQYIGDNASLLNSVTAWCRYTKKNFVDDAAKIIVVDSKSLDAKMIQELVKKQSNGSILIFAGFPDTALIENNKGLRELIGVAEVRAVSRQIYGVDLFAGFLVGGAKRYLPNKESEKKYMDFTEQVPWFIKGVGVKTYAAGILNEEGTAEKDEKGETLEGPILIWQKGASVFVIHDDFIGDQEIQGVLEACTYQASDFTLSPIVNANVFSVSDFALLGEENSSKIESIYSRSTQSLVKEIIWPRLESYSKREKVPFTCYFNTKLDKNTTDLAMSNFDFYLRELRDNGAEAGLSANTINDTLSHKLSEDLGLYNGTGSKFEFTTLFLKKLNAGDVKTITSLDSKLYSLVLKDKGNYGYVDASESIIINAATQDASVYSYKADFAYRSLATALGYGHTLIDMERVMRPESAADEWQNYSEPVSSYLSDFWSKISLFEAVTASESASRAAAYLKNTAIKNEALGTVKGRSIIITGAEPGYFLLRTHDQVISNIKNASFTYLEKDVYVINITNNEAVEITIEERK